MDLMNQVSGPVHQSAPRSASHRYVAARPYGIDLPHTSSLVEVALAQLSNIVAAYTKRERYAAVGARSCHRHRSMNG